MGFSAAGTAVGYYLSMKTLLAFLSAAISTAALAQSEPQPTYRTLSTSINDDKQGHLSIVINGRRSDGQPVLYNRTFDVAGLSKPQKEALTNRVLDSLGIHGPTPPKPPKPPKPAAVVEPEGEAVQFICPTCTGKMELTITGPGHTIARSSDSRDGKPAFPFTATLPPGDYHYSYRQNRVLQMQLPFTVKAGEKNTVTIN